MIRNIEELTSPPEVGEIYLVPSVFGQIALLGSYQVKPPEWWPVLRPSHQDSYYAVKTRDIWKQTDNNRFELVEEEYYEDDPKTPHHFHIDPRFAPDQMYTEFEQRLENWHNVIDIRSEVVWKQMVCLRPMPIQRLFTGFGNRFVEDHRGKTAKCLRCPHRGALLNSMPVVDGVITCPNHGLRFDVKNMKCITGEENGSD